MKDLQSLIHAQAAEIVRLKERSERYRAALHCSSSQEEKRLRQELAAVTQERDALKVELQRWRPRCDEHLNFLLRLSLATDFDAADYANWVRDNAVKLSLGFDQSDECDVSVYGRMQYARSKGFGA